MYATDFTQVFVFVGDMLGALVVTSQVTMLLLVVSMKKDICGDGIRASHLTGHSKSPVSWATARVHFVRVTAAYRECK